MSGITISTKNRFKTTEPFTLSRVAIEEFINCPCCFFVKRGEGFKHPESYPLTFHIKIDKGLKKIFDYYREHDDNHPLIKEQLKTLNINAVPFKHRKLKTWIGQNQGLKIQLPAPYSNITLCGIPDDIWHDEKNNQLFIVDYKATCKSEEVTIDEPWQIAYKRQVGIYQYILQNMINANPDDFPPGCKVADTALFVYLNGTLDNLNIFDDGMRFITKVIPYDRSRDPQFKDINWVRKVAVKAIKCLSEYKLPSANANCDYCQYYAKRVSLDQLTVPSLKRYQVRMDPYKEDGVALFSASQEQETVETLPAPRSQVQTHPSSSASKIETKQMHKDTYSSSYQKNLLDRMNAPEDTVAHVPFKLQANVMYGALDSPEALRRYREAGSGLKRSSSLLSTPYYDSQTAQTAQTAKKPRNASDEAKVEGERKYLRIKRYE